MFPGKLPPGMFMGVKKAMYLITDALHPYCKQNLIMKDMDEAHFVLECKETTKSEGKKLQIVEIKL